MKSPCWSLFLSLHSKRLITLPIKLVGKSAFLNLLLIILFSFVKSVPANIRLDEDVLKTSWRHLSSSSLEDVFKTSSRRLDQDEYVCLSLTSSEDVFKTSWSRPIYSTWTSCKKVFKTSSRRLQDVSSS